MSLPCPTTASLHAACLPTPLGDLVRCLQDRLDLPGPVGTALALQAVAVAVGSAAVLRDDPTPPLSPSLNTFIAAPPGSALPLALDIVMAPLRSIQARLGTLSSAEPSRLASVDSRAVPAEERARAAPFIMTEDSSLAVLLASLAASFDGCLLAIFTPAGWSRFQGELAATPNGSRQRQFVQALAGQACVTKQGKLQPASLTLLAEIRPHSGAWSHLIESLPPDLSPRSLVLDLDLQPTNPRGDTALPPEVAAAWEERQQQLFELRAGVVPVEVELSPAARATIRQFHAELVASASSWPERHHEPVFGLPVLARRLALLLHLADYKGGPVSGTIAETGVALARFYGTHFLSLRDAARFQLEQEALQADCERLLTALKQYPSAKRRELFRRFSGQAYERWNRALEVMVRDGRVTQMSHDEFAVSDNLLPVSSSTV